MKVLTDILYLYIIIYSAFFVYLTMKSLTNKKFKIMQKYSNHVDKKNLCLIIYSHNNEQKLRRLLDSIKQQTYPTENTSVFVILDHCDDNSEKINFAPNVQKFIIKDDHGKIGKKQAISILVEKISEFSIIDAFVFLDINRYIERNFLDIVNISLYGNDVISGSTLLFGENLSIRQKIKSAYQKYKMNFLEKARSCANLYAVIDSDVCAIKREVVEKSGLPDFENLEKDLEYSLNLAKENYLFSFNPGLRSYCEVHDFRIRIPRLSKRINLFFNNVFNLFTINSKYMEFTAFQLCPNILTILLIFAFLVTIPMEDCFLASFSVVIISICAVIISFALSLAKSKMRATEVICLIIYPIYSLFHIIKHFFVFRYIRKLMLNKKLRNLPEEKYVVEAEVTDGRANAPCKIILINEYGMAKVRFAFKNKEISTKSHLRTYDAIEELIEKLEDYGFTVRICQACANFTSNHDGSTNLIKGFCKKQFQVSQESELPTVVWNSCKGFEPKVIVKNRI